MEQRNQQDSCQRPRCSRAVHSVLNYIICCMEKSNLVINKEEGVAQVSPNGILDYDGLALQEMRDRVWEITHPSGEDPGCSPVTNINNTVPHLRYKVTYILLTSYFISQELTIRASVTIIILH